MNDSITFVGPLDPFRATGVQLIQTAKWFIEFGFDLSIRPTSNPYPTKIPQFIRQRIVQKPQRFGWEILFGDGSMAPTPGKNTIYVLNSDPRGRTKAQKSVLNKANEMLPGLRGFDPEVFRPTPIQFSGKTIFGTVWGHGNHKTKNVERVAAAFKNAFKDRVDVALMIKAYPGLKWSLKDKRIHILEENIMPDEAVAQWLNGLHAFVSIGSESTPLWRIHALACGRCVIAPDNDKNVPPTIPLPYSEVCGECSPQWTNVPQSHIEEAMIRVAKMKGGLASVTKSAYDSVKHLTWESAAKVLMDTYARVSASTPNVSRAMKRTCIVQLGRFGDIINILPVAKAIHDRDGIKPVMMVAKHFASVLDGVSYVEPHEFGGNFDELDKATKIAREHYTDVLVTQLHGQNVQATQDSFAKESWKLAGFLSHWGKLPLVFDKRDKEREKKLVDSLKTDKPMLLVNLMGTSSPFQFAEELMDDIRFRWGKKANVVDLSQVRAERIYDLLGLYDEAVILVTSDTSTLHLSQASNILFISLIASVPTLWHGSAIRGRNCVVELRYNEVMERVQNIHSMIESFLGFEHLESHPKIKHGSRFDNESDLIVGFYRSQEIQPKGEIPSGTVDKILTNGPLGLGDTLILTRIPISAHVMPGSNTRYITARSDHFKAIESITYSPECPDEREKVCADFLQMNCRMGNGHFIQRLQRAMGIPPDLKPAPYLKRDGMKPSRSNRVALHFDPGPHMNWQREHIHPRARMLYPESKLEIEKFIASRKDLDFVEFGMTHLNFEGAITYHSKSTFDLIENIAECGWFIGIMSGPLHVAVAMGLKCVVIVNFPSARRIFLPALKDVDIVESEWMYCQNVHLHQEDSGPLVPRLSERTLQEAFDGRVYPYWSDRWLPLIHEKVL